MQLEAPRLLALHGSDLTWIPATPAPSGGTPEHRARAGWIPVGQTRVGRTDGRTDRALSSPACTPQGYLLGEGNISQAAARLLGDVMSKDGFFHLSFAEALRAHSCLSDKLR